MVDVRSRLAALRARRQQRAAAASARPVCSDPALAAAAAAAGLPQQSWDADFKERLAGQADSDDELDQIVVLPPPPVKLDPIAARIAWRKAQIAAANEKAVRILAEQYPVAKLPKPDTAPKEDVNDEEELLLEEEVDDDGEEGDEGDVDEEGEDEGEEDAKEEGEDVGEDNVEQEGDKAVVEMQDSSSADKGEQKEEASTENVPAERRQSSQQGPVSESSPQALTAATSIAQPNHDRIAASKLSIATAPLSQLPTQPPSDTSRQQSEEATISNKAPPKHPLSSNDPHLFEPSPVTPQSSCDARKPRETISAPGPKAKEVISPPDDSAGTVDSSRVTAQLATGSSSTAKSTAKSTVTCAGNGTAREKKGQAFTASSSRAGPFSKLFGGARPVPNGGATASSRPPPPPLRNSAFIDDEAEDEQDGGDDPAMPRADSDTDDDGALRDAGVVADSQVAQGDAERLAQFHRRWEEKNDCETLKNVAGNCKDVDNAMDLTELLQRQQCKAESENDDAASEFCMGDVSLDRSADAAGEYVDAMFRDDNSRSIFDGDLETPEKDADDVELSKRKARALWKARQKNRSRCGTDDENSIALLGLFQDAARGTPEKRAGGKRRTARDVRRTDPALPEWERRRMCLERVEKRRRTAVSIDKWSYESESFDRANRAAAPADRKTAKAKRREAAPVGGGSYAPKPINVQQVRAGSNAAGAAGRKGGAVRKRTRKGGKKASTFKALFDVLDQRPTTDVS